MGKSSRLLALATATCGLAASHAAADPPTAAGQSNPVTFTGAQAQQGQAAYAARCASCHGPSLDGGAARPLKGRTFLGRWAGGNSLGAMFKYIRDKMPPGGAGSISPEEISNIMALILAENGLKPGDVPLPATYPTLQKMRLPFAGDTSG